MSTWFPLVFLTFAVLAAIMGFAVLDSTAASAAKFIFSVLLLMFVMATIKRPN